MVSHDLRNPLNVATGQLALAQEDCSSSHLESVAGALQRMDALIEDMLTLAREGDDVSARESVSVPALLQAAWNNVATGNATLDAPIDLTIMADRSRVQQLLENLFRNAIEHGDDSVTITVGSLGDGFYVADDGPGISEADRERIFEMGYSTSKEGTGFGLSIVKQIVEAHGWKIRVVESDQGGARFEITGMDIDA